MLCQKVMFRDVIGSHLVQLSVSYSILARVAAAHVRQNQCDGSTFLIRRINISRCISRRWLVIIAESLGIVPSTDLHQLDYPSPFFGFRVVQALRICNIARSFHEFDQSSGSGQRVMQPSGPCLVSSLEGRLRCMESYHCRTF